MKKTTNELHTQSALIFQEVQSISRYTSLIKAIDDNIYELACSYDAIDASHPKAATMKDTIANLTSLNALLLEGFGKHADALEEMADQLNMDLSN